MILTVCRYINLLTGLAKKAVVRAFQTYNINKKIQETFEVMFPHRAHHGENILLHFDLGLNAVSSNSDIYVDHNCTRSKKALTKLLSTPDAVLLPNEEDHLTYADDEEDEATPADEDAETS